MVNWQRATSSSEKYSDPIPVQQCALKLTLWYRTALSSQEPLDTKPRHWQASAFFLSPSKLYGVRPKQKPYLFCAKYSSEKSFLYCRVAFCLHVSIHVFYDVSGHSAVYPQLEASLGRNMGWMWWLILLVFSKLVLGLVFKK